MINKTLGLVFVFILAVGLTIGCDKKENTASDKMTSKKTQASTSKAKLAESSDSNSKAPSGHTSAGGTMHKVNTAKTLYTCPMHSEVVSAEASTPCPLCKMELKKMTGAKVKELRSSHPRGCPMDPIVVNGNTKTEKCPVCKMKLSHIH